MKVSSRYPQVPTTLVVEVSPEDVTWYRRIYGEEVTYTWDIPEGLELVRDLGRRVVLNATQAGDFDIAVRVSDTRGNTEDASHPFRLEPTPPYVVSLRTSTSNRYNTAPLDLSVFVSTSEGHRENRVSNVKYYLNGELLESDRAQRAVLPIAEAGEYELEVQVETELGIGSSSTATIETFPNQAPECTLRHSKNSSNVTIEANCRDPDGSVTRYDWLVNGEPVSLTSRRISFARDEAPEGEAIVTINLTATDNGGATSSIEEVISY
jgi:membrane carboxypeptidase/penicillin-binding protein PbpC